MSTLCLSIPIFNFALPTVSRVHSREIGRCDLRGGRGTTARPGAVAPKSRREGRCFENARGVGKKFDCGTKQGGRLWNKRAAAITRWLSYSRQGPWIECLRSFRVPATMGSNMMLGFCVFFGLGVLECGICLLLHCCTCRPSDKIKEICSSRDQSAAPKNRKPYFLRLGSID